MTPDEEWLRNAVLYELDIRGKTVKQLSNSCDIEQMKYVLRVAIEKLEQIAKEKLGSKVNG